MATTNANESRAKDGYYDRNSKAQYRYQNQSTDKNNMPRENQFRPKDSNFRSKENNAVPRDNSYRPRDNGTRPRNDFVKSGEPRTTKEQFAGGRDSVFQPRQNEYRSKDYNKPRENDKFKDNNFRPMKPGNNFNTKQTGFGERGRSSFPYSNSMDKDEDVDSKAVRSRRTMDTKAKTSQSKSPEQTDKLEMIKRLEREKKVVEKKSRVEETEKPKRPVMKEKRSTKDWTKDYEFGLLDEEDAF